MINRCHYYKTTPSDNVSCNRCSLFMDICSPIAEADGYAIGSECDCYLCSGCSIMNCIFKSCVNF